jgi:hypothetical protein
MNKSDVIVDENDLHDRELAELLNNIYLTLEKLELKANITTQDKDNSKCIQWL